MSDPHFKLDNLEYQTKQTNQYPGLKILNVLDDDSLNAEERIIEVSRRIKDANDFIKANPDVFEMDLTALSTDDRLKTLKYPVGVNDKDKTQRCFYPAYPGN